MMNKKSGFIILFLITFVIVTKAQTKNTEEFIAGNKIYKTGSNWLKIGEGVGYHFTLGQLEYNTILAYTFRIKQNYFQAGYHVSSDKFFTQPTLQKLIDFYLTYGKRKEAAHYNIAFFGGISYAYGGTYDHTEQINNKPQKFYRGFTQPGLFGIADLTYKPFYDIGIGTSLYVSINKYYKVLGIQLHFYLSGAYKGTIE